MSKQIPESTMTEKKIEDYLPFYIGCEVMFQQDRRVLRGIVISQEQGMLVSVGLPDFDVFRNEFAKNIKPILRPLSDMTEEECNDYNKKMATLFSLNELHDQIKQEADTTAYLLSKHFDLFGLIEAGIAIDKTKHKE